MRVVVFPRDTRHCDVSSDVASLPRNRPPPSGPGKRGCNAGAGATYTPAVVCVHVGARGAGPAKPCDETKD